MNQVSLRRYVTKATSTPIIYIISTGLWQWRGTLACKRMWMLEPTPPKDARIQRWSSAPAKSTISITLSHLILSYRVLSRPSTRPRQRLPCQATSRRSRPTFRPWQTSLNLLPAIPPRLTTMRTLDRQCILHLLATAPGPESVE